MYFTRQVKNIVTEFQVRDKKPLHQIFRRFRVDYRAEKASEFTGVYSFIRSTPTILDIHTNGCLPNISEPFYFARMKQEHFAKPK